jgi:tRNA 2-thiouridine synthesizing protein A
MTAASTTLDARGMNCPLPIPGTRKALNQLAGGEVLEVIATNPGAVRDMAAFCTRTGNRLISSNEDGGSFVFMIEKP